VALKTIDAPLLKKMFLSGAGNLEANKEYINELNVFPVPDGDTGTNMTLTIMAAAREIRKLEELDMAALAKAISNGSLRGARGNSGVILSQLFRGFSKEIMGCREIDITTLTAAMSKAVETAYKAVMKPKEGTILTVARGGFEKARELAGETDDMAYFIGEVIKHMETVLKATPDMLPVLKEAGVVDSGGQGLVVILKGAYDAMLGNATYGKEVEYISADKQDPVAPMAGYRRVNTENIETSDIKFGYCTEFIILLDKDYDEGKEAEFIAYLDSLGDSIVVVSDEGVVKVHVHTNDPGLVIQRALTYGQLSSIKIDNLHEEHQEKIIKEVEKAMAEQRLLSTNVSGARNAITIEAPKPRKAVGFIAVSVGEGINEIFKGLGVDCLIEGGQTMNPSTEDMLNAIEQVNADSVFILPNNKNIILAAQQAQKMTKDKDVVVIPSKSMPQGIAALVNYVFDKPTDENERRMTEEMKKVKTGQVTYAVRDSVIDGREIKLGDIMGLDDKTIKAVGSDILEVAFELIIQMASDDDELISIYYGAETSREDAEALTKMVQGRFPRIDVELYSGGQPIYYYVFSVE